MPHLLKKLELNGFKSFAQKTTLEFPGGITAIVGPNGSGKSNVVDAIRWLLGEREAKNLRGAKVEDLIFSGTPERPRNSLAEANLFFENHGGYFPVDFSEVSVARQISRDGTSRYFLNKSEVRLKDLVDFFAKARLGTKGLTVISQGNSDMFIKANPVERREMIEETLGLKEYQIKKTRSENQLKNTQINLEKVKALIEEILPHLRSLKRQTNRWEKRGVLEEELKKIEDLLFGSKLAYLQKELSVVKRKIEEHNRHFGKLEAEKKAAEEEEKEIEQSQPKEKEELLKIKKQTSELQEKQIELERDFSRLEVQIEIETRRPDFPTPSTEKLIKLTSSIRSKLKAVIDDEDIASIRTALKGIISEIDSSLKAPGENKEVKPSEALKQKINKVETDLKAIKAEVQSLKAKENLLEKKQGEFYEAFKNAVTKVETVKSRLEEWGSHNQKLIFEKEKLELRIEEVNRQINQVGRTPEEFKHLIQNINLGQGLESPVLADLDRRALKIRGDLASIGEVDEAVMKEASETENRYEFLKRELEDAEKAQIELKEIIKDLEAKIKNEFQESLSAINKEFNNFFKLMFDGGHAKLVYKKEEKKEKASLMGEAEEGSSENSETEEKDFSKREEGIEITLSLPRKKISSLEVLSGGERSLVGIAALFSIISVSPPPFLVLDEIDAPLDERNARRFSEMLKSFSKRTQFIIVTHNRASMEVADILYGVTLNSDGTSKVISMKLEPIN